MSACNFSPSGPCTFVSRSGFLDVSGRGEDLTVQICKTCGIGVTHPLMDDVAPLYADRNTVNFQPNAVGLGRLIKTFFFKAQAGRLLAKIQPRPKRLIDYGCGGGLLTRMLGDHLGAEQVIGVDYHDTPPPELIDRPYLSYAAFGASDPQADALIAFHVLEHAANPAILLAQMTSAMRPGTLLVIEVPHIGCVLATWFGRFWGLWATPYHRYHFSRESLRHLLDSGGFDVLEMCDVSLPTMGHTLANRAGRPNTLLFLLAGAALHPFQMLVEKLTGQPSGLRVFARKRG